jgi:hypothetical protein
VAPASVTQPVPQVEEGSGRLVWVMAFAALCAVVAVLVCAGLGGMATVAALLSG